eukprot:GEMP01010140.1.p1 GENE.GEMP01010140.1~~GEMP01010140.1.p1  ORF type:complete len:612 (+),score=108.15 GEMP01010140.1:62-1897(+)
MEEVAPLSRLPSPKGGVVYVFLSHVTQYGANPSVDSSCALFGAGLPSCRREFCVRVSGPSIEPAIISSPSKGSIWEEEILTKLLDYCGAEPLVIELIRGKIVIAKGSIPLRCAYRDMTDYKSLSLWMPMEHLGVTTKDGRRYEIFFRCALLMNGMLGDAGPPRENCKTALGHAVAAKMPILTSALLPFGTADFNNILDLAIKSSGQGDAIVELLCNRLKGVGRPDGSHLLAAISRRNPALVQFILKNGGGKTLHHNGVTALSAACRLSEVEIAEIILEYGKEERVAVDPSQVNVSTDTEERQTTNGVPGPNDNNSEGQKDTRPVDMDVWYEPGWQLVQCGAPPAVHAARSKKPAALLKLLTSYGLSVDARCPDGRTALMEACEMSNDPQIPKLLLKLGARQTSCRNLCFTPLHILCQVGHWELLQPILEATIKQATTASIWGPQPATVTINSLDAYSRSPLDIALAKLFPEVTADTQCNDKNKLKERAFVLRACINEAAEEQSMLSKSTIYGDVIFADLIQTLRKDWSAISHPVVRKPKQAVGGIRWASGLMILSGCRPHKFRTLWTAVELAATQISKEHLIPSLPEYQALDSLSETSSLTTAEAVEPLSI